MALISRDPSLLQQSVWLVVAIGGAALMVGCTRPPTTTNAPPTPTPRFPHADDFVTQETIDPYTPYEQRRRNHQTRLSKRGPAVHHPWEATPEGARIVKYRSDGRELRGWLFVPEDAAAQRRPGVVYLHNDFALTELSWDNSQPLRDAGFVR